MDENTYESIFLPGLRTLIANNSDDPPGSFHSRDIFSPHPTLPNTWKYLGRLDDRINLLNGEKVLPLPIEGSIRRVPLVKEAVVFGVGRSVPGLLLFRAASARNLNDKQFIDAVWPSVQQANAQAEAFSRISRDMVIPLPTETECPAADKGSIIRPQVYKKFESLIEKAYHKLDESSTGTLELDVAGLEDYLTTIFTSELDLELPSSTTDFFSVGMDSLKATQARHYILRDIFLGDNSKYLSRNVVFECGNIKSLARKVFDIRIGAERGEETGNKLEVVEKSISENSSFISHFPFTASTSTGDVVVSIPSCN